jgi:hypothetical protein
MEGVAVAPRRRTEMKKSMSLDVSRLLGFKLVAGDENQKDAPSPELLCRDPRIGTKIGKVIPDGDGVMDDKS